MNIEAAPGERVDGAGRNAEVRDGADAFVIEGGWIVAQTIHYTVEPGRPQPCAGMVPR